MPDARNGNGSRAERRRRGERCRVLADRCRTLFIDRLDDNLARGMLGEIIGDIEPCLESAGYDREDFIRAIQEAIFPEEFAEQSTVLEQMALVPKKGPRTAGEDCLRALLTDVKRSSGDKWKPSDN